MLAANKHAIKEICEAQEALGDNVLCKYVL